MEKDLDIIPIHVVADSRNKAEMLNGLLRAQGLAVRPVWSDNLEDWPDSPAELVFYFADTENPTLAEVLKHAEGNATPVIIVAREHDPEEAARALAAGAADWIRAEHDELLAAVARRERAKRRVIHRLRQFERENERDRRHLENLFSASQDAIARLNDGIVVEANAACAELFGYGNPQALVGLPLMDLFAPASQTELKRSLKAANKGSAPREAVNLIARRADGGERETKVEFATLESGEQREIQIVVRGTDASSLRIEKLEAKNKQLKKRLATLKQREAGSRLLWPANFAPIAAERISHARTGSVRAIVAIQPADPEAALKTFGPLGLAEAGASLAGRISALLEEEDLATRIADSSLLALVSRSDEEAVRDWVAAVLKALGTRFFEGAGHSGHLEFAAGYVPVDRVRHLDALVRQALAAASGEAGSVSRSKGSVETAAVETDDTGWAALIREALDEHRYTIALRPIEDVASGDKLYEALPRLLDRDGMEIPTASFYPPAARLGLLPALEHRLAGHALLAQQRSPLNGKAAPHMIVPLRAETMTDVAFDAFMKNLRERVRAQPSKSLVLELDLNEVMSSVRDVEQFAERMGKLGYGLGLRNYEPSVVTDKLIALLPLCCLRLTPGIMERIGENEALAASIRTAAENMRERNIRMIATGIGDHNTMARVYNLGIGTVQGTVVGEAESFSAAGSTHALLNELGPGGRAD